MKLSSAQQLICDDPHRFRVVIAGRRFGKTYLSINEMAKFARHSRRKIVYIAPTYRQAKQTIWNDLKEQLYRVNWIRRVNESELTITLVNDSQIMVRSADNFDSLRGLGIDFVVFDEFADIDQRTWTEVVRAALSDRQGHALFIGTPKGTGNWAKDIYDQGYLLDDWRSFQFTTLDGGRVPDSEIASARLDLDERTFRQEYMATFETYSQAIYYNYDVSCHVTSEVPLISDREVLHVGMDFNTNPMSAVICQQRQSESGRPSLAVIDEIEIYGSNTLEMANEIRIRYPRNPIWVYPDASGGNSNTKGSSDHNILRQAGFTVRSNRSNPPVRDRIVAVNSALMSASGEVRLSINKKCRRLQECLTKQTYKGDTRQPDKDSGYDHMNDALGYVVAAIMPVTRPEPERRGPEYYGAV